MRGRWDSALVGTDPDFSDVRCPHCGHAEVSVQSLFGSTSSEVLLFCEGCRTCFNWLKWRRQLPPLAAQPRHP